MKKEELKTRLDPMTYHVTQEKVLSLLLPASTGTNMPTEATIVRYAGKSYLKVEPNLIVVLAGPVLTKPSRAQLNFSQITAQV